MRLLPKIQSQKAADDPQTEIEQQLLRREAVLGGQVFGTLPKGHTRQFFCMDERTWIWHEEWSDKQGNHVVTTRYDVRPGGILKSQNGAPYCQVSEDEARNLSIAAKLYLQHVSSDYDRMLAAA